MEGAVDAAHALTVVTFQLPHRAIIINVEAVEVARVDFSCLVAPGVSGYGTQSTR